MLRYSPFIHPDSLLCLYIIHFYVPPILFLTTDYPSLFLAPFIRSLFLSTRLYSFIWTLLSDTFYIHKAPLLVRFPLVPHFLYPDFSPFLTIPFSRPPEFLSEVPRRLLLRLKTTEDGCSLKSQGDVVTVFRTLSGIATFSRLSTTAARGLDDFPQHSRLSR
jgi:hypothetical protein